MALGQGAAGPSVAPGTFVGRDSLGSENEPGTLNRVRPQVSGTATWSIELDSLDLRRKFTMRLEIPDPWPVTIVLRALDSLPLAAGSHRSMLPATGASHRLPRTVHADIYSVEGGQRRHYTPAELKVTITAVSTVRGQPVVVGHVDARSMRYGERTPGQGLFPVVRLVVAGDFASRAAAEVRPRIVVTSRMQELVLARALDGFAITNTGAINGDGDADSTREATRARRFIESRWSDALEIEQMEVKGMEYQLRVRGRHAPVVCEVESVHGDIECTTMPAPVRPGGAAGRISGRVARELAPHVPPYLTAVTVHLLPNPAPIKGAFKSYCHGRERDDSIAAVRLEAKMLVARDSAAMERAFASIYAEDVPPYRKGYRALFEKFASHHATVGSDGRYDFARVPPGNYLVVSARPSEDRIEWYVPVTVHGGEQLARDLDGSNQNGRGWSCGTPLPFPAVR
ncbi:MAG: hypothetical protein LH467_13105 [Gemmatimonadaceae bacterium]|nr:hypothetical protein [Gemmatimonadaceae bacterium]